MDQQTFEKVILLATFWISNLVHLDLSLSLTAYKYQQIRQCEDHRISHVSSLWFADPLGCHGPLLDHFLCLPVHIMPQLSYN